MLQMNTPERLLDIENIATCIGCGCDDMNCCPEGCAWLTVDRAAGLGVCTGCEQHLQRWEMGERDVLRLSLNTKLPDEEYGRAVLKLLTIAQGDTGGAEPAARVLLSAYNGYDFNFGIPDLSLLDPGNFTAALTVIMGRAGATSREPHTVIDDGDAIFQQLATQWQHLNINREEA